MNSPDAKPFVASTPPTAYREAPSRDLFENFDTISRLVTLAHYEDDLNVPTTEDFLIPLEALIKEGGPSPKPQPAAPPRAPIPMMAYDPSKFRKPDSDAPPAVP